MHKTPPAPTHDDILGVIAPLSGLEGPLLPMLHALQAAYRCIPAGAIAVLADKLNITKAEVHGVISFYHDFREQPAGRHVLKICRAEACQSMGANVIAEATLAKLGIDWHNTTADGAITIEPVYCLGLCACAPAAMMDGRVVGRIDAAKLDRMLAEAGA